MEQVVPLQEEKVVGLHECPKCHGSQIRLGHFETGETPRTLGQAATCLACSTTWSIIYRLVSIELNEPTIKDVVNGPGV